MGWLKLGSRSSNLGAPAAPMIDVESKYRTQHIEILPRIPESLNVPKHYPVVSLDTPDERLPFIPADDVKESNCTGNGSLLIVIDNIVFDCTSFLKEHPGGEQIINSFGGAECSWQFWRFHGEKEMKEFGRALRVGRTQGMINKFKEPQKYVGLRRLGPDDRE